jgi:hypothetical protein
MMIVDDDDDDDDGDDDDDDAQGLEKQKLTMEREMEEMLARNCSEEEMARYLDQFKELYADYGNQRRKEVSIYS